MDRRKIIYLDDAVEAVVGCTNCGTEDVLRAYVVKHSLENGWTGGIVDALDAIEQLPSVQPERLTDDDLETIRIHLNAYKEKLCNQKRWEEAEEYQRIIDRFMTFASAQPEQRWIPCSERQPDVNGWYVTTISGEICGQDRAFSGMSEFANGKWMSGDDVDETEMTIAWMPLPEAYQEGEKE